MSDVSHVYSCGVRFWTNEVWLWVGLPVKRLEENTQSRQQNVSCQNWFWSKRSFAVTKRPEVILSE